jgi:mono/diheme cytochrome c family protein
MRYAFVFAIVLLVAAGVFFMRSAGANESSFAYNDPDVVALGQSLYQENCAACHGRDLEGEGSWRERDASGYLPAPPHDENGHTWHHPDAQLFEITKIGTAAVVGGDYKSNMEAFEGVLTDDEVVAVLAFIKSTWPQRIIDRHDQLNAAYDKARKP